MSSALTRRIAAAQNRKIDPAVVAFAETLTRDGETANDAVAVLFYGSNLRTGSREGVLDFYVLAGGEPESGLWPRVSYREWDYVGPDGESERLRAKIAHMTLAMFARAASGTPIDTTIWARFVQPSAIVWSRDEALCLATMRALAAAAITAARLAAATGPRTGTEEDFWAALFRATYLAELRVEAAGRERSILEANRDHFAGLLPAAWEAGGIAYEEKGRTFAPRLTAAMQSQTLRWWTRRRRLGKLLNVARLVRATFTFEGAARYAAWKIERHTGVALEVTPWRERHPLLAAPGVAWALWRARGKRKAQEARAPN